MADRSFFDNGSDFVDLAETHPNSVQIKFIAQIKLSSELTSLEEYYWISLIVRDPIPLISLDIVPLEVDLTVEQSLMTKIFFKH